jgi:hypothetical protein
MPARLVSCATAPNGDTDVFVLTQVGGLWHTVRLANGAWPFGWGDVRATIAGQGNPDVGPIRLVSCAVVQGGGNTHVFVIDQASRLWHTIRP